MSGKHFLSLDGLRGAAILLVVLYHVYPHRGTGYFGYLCGGAWVGVDLFFVLSGFLITGILFDTQGAPGFYRNFYMRRALRLFPLYLVFIAVTLVVAHGSNPHSLAITLAALFYGSNIIRMFHPDFYTVGPVEIGHLWSLAVEEQFYLVWPWILVALATRQRILRACLYTSGAALLLRVLLGHLPLPDTTFLYLELPTRADALLTGAAVAMLFRDPGFMARLRPAYLRAIGLTCAAAFLLIAVQANSFYFGFPPINTWGLSFTAIGSACLLLLSLLPGTWSSRLFAHPLLRFYGRYSYGLYLIHYAPNRFYHGVVWPAILRHIHAVWLAGAVYLALVLGVSTALAVLSFHLVEKPFLNLKRLFQSRRTAAG